jgi:hypothetical protein
LKAMGECQMTGRGSTITCGDVEPNPRPQSGDEYDSWSDPEERIAVLSGDFCEWDGQEDTFCSEDDSSTSDWSQCSGASECAEEAQSKRAPRRESAEERRARVREKQFLLFHSRHSAGNLPSLLPAGITLPRPPIWVPAEHVKACADGA